MDFFVQAPNHGIVSGGSHVFRARKPSGGGAAREARRHPATADTLQRRRAVPTVPLGSRAATVAQPHAEAVDASEDDGDADRRRFAQQFGEQAAAHAAREVGRQQAARQVGEQLGSQYEEEEDVGLRTGAGHRVDVRKGAWDPEDQAVEYVWRHIVGDTASTSALMPQGGGEQAAHGAGSQGRTAAWCGCSCCRGARGGFDRCSAGVGARPGRGAPGRRGGSKCSPVGG